MSHISHTHTLCPTFGSLGSVYRMHHPQVPVSLQNEFVWQFLHLSIGPLVFLKQSVPGFLGGSRVDILHLACGHSPEQYSQQWDWTQIKPLCLACDSCKTLGAQQHSKLTHQAGDVLVAYFPSPLSEMSQGQASASNQTNQPYTCCIA